MPRLHFGVVDDRPSDVAHVVRKNVQHNIGDGLDNMSIGQAGCARLLEIAGPDFAALHHNGPSELQNSVGLFDRGVSMSSLSNLIFREPNFAADECVRAQTVAAHVALGDSEGDLFPELRVEAAGSKSVAKVDIGRKSGWRIAEHTNQVRHGAILVLGSVEESLGFSSCLGRIELIEAIHIFGCDFEMPPVICTLWARIGLRCNWFIEGQLRGRILLDLCYEFSLNHDLTLAFYDSS